MIPALASPWQYTPITFSTRSRLSAFLGLSVNVGGIVRFLANAAILRDFRTLFGEGIVNCMSGTYRWQQTREVILTGRGDEAGWLGIDRGARISKENW